MRQQGKAIPGGKYIVFKVFIIKLKRVSANKLKSSIKKFEENKRDDDIVN